MEYAIASNLNLLYSALLHLQSIFELEHLQRQHFILGVIITATSTSHD